MFVKSEFDHKPFSQNATFCHYFLISLLPAPEIPYYNTLVPQYIPCLHGAHRPLSVSLIVYHNTAYACMVPACP